MVQMDLHVAEAAAAESGQRVEQLRLVAFLRKEEGVLWRAPVRVGKSLGHPRVVFHPGGDACPFDVEIDGAMARLEVIGDAEEDVLDAAVGPRLEDPVQAL